MSTQSRPMPPLDRSPAQPSAADLCTPSPSVRSEDTNATVLELFGRHPELANLPVLAEQAPIGMIKRHVFLSELAKPFHKEVYERKSCLSFMDRGALVVDAAATLEQISFAIVESGGTALTDGFLIVREGRFIGVGSGLDLMRLVAHQQAEKNRQIMQSIDYASVIQRAMLRPSHDALFATLADVGLAWQPRDIVGGDFYHFAPYPDGWFLALADCTGHGVPGAFMTLISSSWLGRTLERVGPRDPARLFAELNRSVKTSLGQTRTRQGFDDSDDGLDALALWFDAASSTLTCASARTSLHVLTPAAAEAQTFEGDRMGLGYVDTPMDHAWSNRRIVLEAGTIVCATTDGMVDQIGGVKHIAYGKRRVRDAMRAARDLPMPGFAAALLDEHARYQAGHSRRDDLTLFCFRA